MVTSALDLYFCLSDSLIGWRRSFLCAFFEEKYRIADNDLIAGNESSPMDLQVIDADGCVASRLNELVTVSNAMKCDVFGRYLWILEQINVCVW